MRKITTLLFALCVAVSMAQAKSQASTNKTTTKPLNVGHRSIATYKRAATDNEKALFTAIEQGDATKVKELLNKEVNPNVTDKDGNTPLTLAIVKGQYTGIVPVLREAGAKLNPQSPMAETIFATAPKAGSARGLEVMQFGLAEGINPNTAKDENGNTALINAVKANNTDLIDFLLEAGADINQRGGELNSPAIFYATFSRDFLISKGADVNLRGGDLNTLLFRSILLNPNDYLETRNNIMLLLKSGANPHIKGTDNNKVYTPLSLLKHSHVFYDKNNKNELIKLLQEAEKRTTATALTTDERSLIKAAQKGDKQSVLALVKKGTNFWIMDDKGNTPFVIVEQAIQNRDTDFLKQLTELGISIDYIANVSTLNADTPLTRAARRCDLAEVKYLVNMGANAAVKIYPMMLQNALEVAYSNYPNKAECAQIVDFLMALGFTISDKDIQRADKYKATYSKFHQQGTNATSNSISDTLLQGLANFTGALIDQQTGTNIGSTLATSNSSTSTGKDGTCQWDDLTLSANACNKCVNSKPRTQAACTACCNSIGQAGLYSSKYYATDPAAGTKSAGYFQPGCYCHYSNGKDYKF